MLSEAKHLLCLSGNEQSRFLAGLEMTWCGAFFTLHTNTAEPAVPHLHHPVPQRAALRKLAMLDAATELRDLVAPPENRLEPLRGDRKGEHRIRINDQWRICFVWKDSDAYGVEITDYH